MDDESKQLLREIRDLQIKQLELLKAAMLPPWLRWRFSLRALLVFITLVAVLLGSLVLIRSIRMASQPAVVPPTPTVPFGR